MDKARAKLGITSFIRRFVAALVKQRGNQGGEERRTECREGREEKEKDAERKRGKS